MGFGCVFAAAMRLAPRAIAGIAGDRNAASGLTMLQQGNASAPIRNRPGCQARAIHQFKTTAWIVRFQVRVR
jgi:hypothetical protein